MSTTGCPQHHVDKATSILALDVSELRLRLLSLQLGITNDEAQQLLSVVATNTSSSIHTTQTVEFTDTVDRTTTTTKRHRPNDNIPAEQTQQEQSPLLPAPQTSTITSTVTTIPPTSLITTTADVTTNAKQANAKPANNTNNNKQHAKENNNNNNNNNSKTLSNNKPTGLNWNNVHRRRIALRFSYIGTDFNGFAYQKGEEEAGDAQRNKGGKRPTPTTTTSTKPTGPEPVTTVEGELLKALKTACLIQSYEGCNYTKCGRTDKGVHGLAQVVALDIKTKWRPPMPSVTHTIADTQYDSQNISQTSNGDHEYYKLNNFSCWCDIPGYIPPYTTPTDYVVASHTMQHHVNCRRTNAYIAKHGSVPNTTMVNDNSNCDNNNKIQNQNDNNNNTMSDDLTPTTTTTTTSQPNTIRSNNFIFTSHPKFRVLGVESEYHDLYQQITNEIKDQPLQIQYYSTKQQATLDTYSQYEVDWYLGKKFRPCYGESTFARDFNYKLMEWYVEQKQHKQQQLTTNTANNNTAHNINSSSCQQPLVIDFTNHIATNWELQVQFEQMLQNEYYFPLTQTANYSDVDNMQLSNNNTNNSPSSDISKLLTSYYQDSKNHTFNTAVPSTRTWDNPLIVKYAQYNVHPKDCASAYLSTYSYPFILQPLTLFSALSPTTDTTTTNENNCNCDKENNKNNNNKTTINYMTNIETALSSMYLDSQTLPLLSSSSVISNVITTTNNNNNNNVINNNYQQLVLSPPNSILDSSIYTTQQTTPFALASSTAVYITANAISPTATPSRADLAHTTYNTEVYTKHMQNHHLPQTQLYSHDALLPHHPDQEWVDTCEIDYVNMLNRLLPPEIRVLAWAPVPPSFSARFQSDGRAYKYFFYLDGMDLCAMNRAAKYLIGSYDFRNICTMDVVNVTSYKRVISDIAVQPVENNDVMDYIIGQHLQNKREKQQQQLQLQNDDDNNNKERNNTNDNNDNLTIIPYQSTTIDKHLDINVFNTNALLQNDAVFDNTVCHYMPCKHQTTTEVDNNNNNNTNQHGCYLCHTSATANTSILCETIIVGESFLYHQVRSIMGLLFMIGRGEEKAEIIPKLLDITTNPRRPHYEFASDKGLVLWECAYHNLAWKTSQGGVMRGLQSIFAKWREMKLQTHIVETMWRNMIPSIVAMVNEFLRKLLYPVNEVYEYITYCKQGDNKVSNNNNSNNEKGNNNNNNNNTKNTKDQYTPMAINDGVFGHISLLIQQHRIYKQHCADSPGLLIDNDNQQQQQQKQNNENGNNNANTNTTMPKSKKNNRKNNAAHAKDAGKAHDDVNKKISLFMDYHRDIRGQWTRLYEIALADQSGGGTWDPADVMTSDDFIAICEWLFKLFHFQLLNAVKTTNVSITAVDSQNQLQHNQDNIITTNNNNSMNDNDTTTTTIIATNNTTTTDTYIIPTNAEQQYIDKRYNITTSLLYNNLHSNYYNNVHNIQTNSIPYHSASPHNTNQRLLAVVPYPLLLISPTLPQFYPIKAIPQYLATQSNTTNNNNIKKSTITPTSFEYDENAVKFMNYMLRILNVYSFQHELATNSSAAQFTRNIYIILLYTEYILTTLLAPNVYAAEMRRVLEQQGIMMLSERLQNMIYLLTKKSFLFATMFSHVPLFDRPLEATLEEKLQRLHGTRKQRKDRNLELENVYGHGMARENNSNAVSKNNSTTDNNDD